MSVAKHSPAKQYGAYGALFVQDADNGSAHVSDDRYQSCGFHAQIMVPETRGMTSILCRSLVLWVYLPSAFSLSSTSFDTIFSSIANSPFADPSK
jgi:hypothetical protein